MKWKEKVISPRTPEQIKTRLRRNIFIAPSFSESPIDFLFYHISSHPARISGTIHKNNIYLRSKYGFFYMNWILQQKNNQTHIQIIYPRFFVKIILYFGPAIGLSLLLLSSGISWAEFIEMMLEDPLAQVFGVVFGLLLPIFGPIVTRKIQISFRDKMLRMI